MATPHAGGHIERLIGTILGRVHRLCGTTGRNAQDKGACPAESESVLTMAELTRWLAIQVCEQYHWRHFAAIACTCSTFAIGLQGSSAAGHHAVGATRGAGQVAR